MKQNIAEVTENVARNRVQGALDGIVALDQIIEGVEVPRASAEAFAVLCPAPWTLVGILHPDDTSAAAEEIAAFLHDIPTFSSITIKDNIVFVMTSASETASLTSSVLAHDGFEDCQIALSLTFDALDCVLQQYRLVVYCLGATHESGLIQAKDKALEFIKEEISSNNSFESLLHPALKVLREYDRANQSNMLETLRVYLDNDRNAQRCASILYLHRNSLQYRIRRIQEIADLNLGDPAERMWLRLSFFISS